MSKEILEKLRAQHANRVRRVKRVLRPLPRRSNVHRYPVLKWFAETAKSRMYLWSFKPVAVIPAIYAGCLLAFAPLYGFQLILAFAAALVLRANLPIMVGLQFITNPLTLGPIYATAVLIGSRILNFSGSQEEALEFAEALSKEALEHEVMTSPSSVSQAINFFQSAVVGGIVLGLISGVILHISYKIASNRATATLAHIRKIQVEHEANQAKKTTFAKTGHKKHTPNGA